MEKAAAWIRRCFSVFFAVVACIGGAVSGEASIKTGNMEIARTLEFSYADGVSFCQGLAMDGKTFYGIGAVKFLNYNAITKIDIETGEIIERREMCLPKELMKKGYSHLGDGCIYQGKLYIALEDFGFRHPGVIVYDPVTLEAVDSVILEQLLLYPVLENWYPVSARWDPFRKIWNMAALCISCQLFTAPLAWLRFHSFPRYFLLTNLLAIPVTSVLMGTALLTLLLQALGCCPPLLLTATDSLCRLLLWILEVIAGM